MEAKEGIEERKEHKQKGNKLCEQKKSNDSTVSRQNPSTNQDR